MDFDSKGFQELHKIEKPQNIDKQMQILDLKHQVQYAKQKIDINRKETELLIKEIKDCKIKLAEIIGTDNEEINN